MSRVGELSVALIGEVDKLRRGIKASMGDIDSFANKFKAMGKNISNVGGKLTKSITLPFLALAGLSVKAASDAEEIQSKFAVVFGVLTKEVEEWISDFADQVNRSETTLKEFAASFQDTFVPLGATRAEAAEFSKQLVELTIDLASFNNAAEPEVMNALQSAIVGNHETVRRYGVIITQTTLDQELMNMGITEGVKVATNLQKAQARLNIIVQGTSDAQGDATRTAGSFANQFKALLADVKDLGEELGRELIPTVLGLMDKIRGWIAAWKDLDYDTKRMILTVAALAAALGPLLLLVGKLTVAVGYLATAFKTLHLAILGPIALAIGALLGLFSALTGHMITTKAYWIEFWNALRRSVETSVNSIIGFVNLLFEGINKALDLINKLPFVNIGKFKSFVEIDITPVVIAQEAIVTELIDISGAVQDVAPDVGEYLGRVKADIVGKLIETNTHLETLGLDFKMVGETLNSRLKEISDTLGTGVLAAAVATLDAMVAQREALGAQLSDVVESVMHTSGAVRQAETSQRAAAAALLAAMDAQDLATAQAARESLEKADAALAAAKARHQTALADHEISKTLTVLDREIIDQLALVKNAMYAASTSFGVSIADGFLTFAGDLDSGLTALSLDISKFTGDATDELRVTFEDEMFDLSVKIGENTFQLSTLLKAIEATTAGKMGEMIGGLGGVLTAITTVGSVVLGILYIAELLGIDLKQFFAALGRALSGLWDIAKAILGFLENVLTVMLAPFILIAKVIGGILQFFVRLFGGGKGPEGTTVPTYHSGGIVAGALGEERIIRALGGERITAVGSIPGGLDYTRLGNMIAAGVADGIARQARGAGTSIPIELNLDGQLVARILYPFSLMEGARRGEVNP